MNCHWRTILARAAICIAALVCGARLALGAQAYTLVPNAGPPPTELPAALRDVVAADGLEVKSASGVLCDLWLRKEVPVAAAASQELGVTFGQLSEGTLIGVMRIGTDTTDYRNQKVKAGLYTLRYAWSPVDGNHQGVAPQRDFALLSPVAEDSDPATVSRDEAIKRSTKTTGTKHPSVWSLWPGDDSASAPALKYQDDSQSWLLTFRLTLAGGAKISVGLVVFGRAPEA
ncbi:MAG TPA: hypothetical protein VEG63_03890 [Candidatus Acidoferrales bacterium]|nr:hypothetical protein [Candidatus Acidoferrales bacterium]